jgi:uncharacterized protein YgiM (DUF1202 family)
MRKKIFALCLIILTSLIISACAGDTKQASGPSVPVADITSPATNSTAMTGQPVTISFSARDVNGVKQIELVVNGEPVLIQPISPVNIYSAEHQWTPQTVGSYVIELRAFNVDGNVSEPAQIFMTVNQAEAVLPEAPTPEPPTPTATFVLPTMTPIPLDTETPVPTETNESNQEPTVTTEPTEVEVAEGSSSGYPTLTVISEAIFVRAGPGTNYDQVGKLDKNEVAPITGRDAKGAWWQIVYPPGTDKHGWVSGDAQFATITNAENVAVVAVDADVVVVVTKTPAPTDTPTPDTSGRPVIHNFTADRADINIGEKAVLKWDLSEAKEAYLRFDDKQEGVIAPGEKTVFPRQNTTYTLIARNDVGESTAEITINVDTENPVALLGPPAIYYFSADRFHLEGKDDEDNVVLLKWELANAKEAYLRYDEKEQGIVSPGEKTVVPKRDTTYKLEARNDNGQTVAELTITFGSTSAANGSSPPAINAFTTDQLEINRGESAILRWDIANAKEAHLSYNGNNEGVASPGEKSVSPSNETRYRLEAKNDSGKTVAELTIKVR